MDKRNRKGCRLSAIALWCILSLATQLAAADGTFACHVDTASGQPGIFFAQTDDMREVQEAALRARVKTIGRKQAQVTGVVQCIHYPGGRFSDATMQAYLKNLPL